MKVILSVIGLYNYDNTVLDTFHVPADVDAEQLRTRIFMECGELPVMFPDPDLFKVMLDKWSLTKLPLWERMARAAAAEYDLLHNYDRTETETINTSGSETTTRTDTGRTSDTGTRTTAGEDDRTITEDRDTANTGTLTTRDAGEGTSTEAVTAFNSSTFADSRRVEDTHDNSIQRTDALNEAVDATTSDNLIHNSTETVNSSGTTSMASEGERANEEETTRSVRAYGNIGVTTNQQMLESEINLIPRLDVYSFIVSDFTDAFCIGVY